MKHLKRLILFVAAAIIVVLTTATIVESSKGTPFVREHIYSALWFVVLWAALAVAATVTSCYVDCTASRWYSSSTSHSW